MSSDYIPRLRRELLRAGASKQARWPMRRAARALRPLAGAAAVAAVAVVAVAVVLVLSGGRSDETPAERTAAALHLTYRLEPSGAAVAEHTAQVMRARLADAGIPNARVSVSPSAGLTITAPATARADVTALAQPGRVGFYDWERSVLGPRGAPAPDDAGVTGGVDAGRAAALTKAEAQARAAGLPGARVVRAVGDTADRWFVLGGAPALTETDIERADSTVDEIAQQPIVTIELTARGQTAFSALTRVLAHRGSEEAARGVDDTDAFQHLAIVIDDQIVAVPYINYREAPDGIDGSDGAPISGDLTPQSARRIATILNTGPLPAALSNPTGPSGG